MNDVIINGYWATRTRLKGYPGGVVIAFPELPNVYACGTDVPSAIRNAHQAIDRWIEEGKKKGADMPRQTFIKIQVPPKKLSGPLRELVYGF
jgi:predicted RNase H-like HicB family nuclease